MKFANYLTKISGVSIYPLFSLILFVLFFTLVIIWAYKTDSVTVEYIENLPLEDGNTSK
ncbi:MAG: CcoQ/FixQ family Cbb3-type cytochrome c oxidase assembly chaperone [Saprospiraceae bacterium]|jgi:cytochrome c oxidase cbb3-type subunit 4|uniref:hypothetical protein n=1 Tax=Candidatus Brachybacter algidus TaxID=2982024 RepID=UPI001B4AD376|nr:hypothetical protein [Candidatus Brachybacter algidus]MBP7305156.1 hypothetical protein [Saprospiraceae bacterium]MBK6372902.1 CcoQ/FixQ family Cbb3-type cytochrome c oxidase assembly chaperone [Candidatus Brachybacter algidus]MBK6448129.1 CcoQ/FixQ family Cbb3-type cytochrome c oxidase assembly chaperone [Candidatus Brachybacter algidus]MBK7602942.1 CcoQ/FixQ family Cbb3-type cytochrome c oxidase assembly chaperone [Candidatus Brachybacter algidus]MBK8354393.1 CcoQ/FixQ family Cbb3-type cy